MAKYKKENGNYFRQSSDGTWFKVKRNGDYLTWTLPNGYNMRAKITLKNGKEVVDKEEHLEEPSVAENAWNKLTSGIAAVSPVQQFKDVYNYTKNYFSDTKPAAPGLRTLVPNTDKGNFFTGLVKDVGGKLLERVSNGLSFLNFLSPTLWYGATRNIKRNGFNFRRMGNSMLNGNSGLVTSEFAEQHPYIATISNTVGDIAISSPKTIINLIKSGLNNPPLFPSLSPTLVTANNAQMSTSFPKFSTNNWNIPITNNINNSYMALGETRSNPSYNSKSKNYSTSKAYPYILEVTPEELEFLKELARKNNIDLSNIDISLILRVPERFNFSRTIEENGKKIKIGLIGKGGFNSFLYKLTRSLKDLELNNSSRQIFNNLGVRGKLEFLSNAKDGRALAADIRGLLYSDGYLTIDNLDSKDFDFTSGDLVEYLNSAHGGAFANLDNTKIKGFKRITLLDPKTGNPINYLEWDKSLSEDQINEIVNNWKQAILSFKNGSKLLSRRVNKKLD